MLKSLNLSVRFAILVLAQVIVGSYAVAEDPDSGLPPKRHFLATTPDAATRWQQDCRKLIFDLLKMKDLQATREAGGQPIPFEVRTISTENHPGFVKSEIELNSTPTRRIKAILTVPGATTANGKHPAMVCIHGHGGSRNIVYDEKSVYKGFATELAESGYITISTDVGQHEVFEEGRTLMGERLWDVLRCADYLASLTNVDTNRMGCAGLSLGGEMSMWLGAMDPRMQVTVSSGFLTTVANLKNGHCQCWDFPGFTENFDFSDIYSLIAPRALMCQIGELERAPGGFPPNIARDALADIQKTYAVFKSPDQVTLDVHPSGHIYVIPSAQRFVDEHIEGKSRKEFN